MSSDGGSASLLSLLAGVGVVGATVVAGGLVGGVVVHTRAQTSADMVALAAAGSVLTEPDPCAVAVSVAVANSVTVLECEPRGSIVTVTVGSSLPVLWQELFGSRLAQARSSAEVVLAEQSW